MIGKEKLMVEEAMEKGEIADSEMWPQVWAFRSIVIMSMDRGRWRSKVLCSGINLEHR